MKCFVICGFLLTLAAATRADAKDDLIASPSENSASTQLLTSSASSLSPWQEKHQEKRYVGGYAGVGAYGTGLDAIGSAYGAGYYNPYQSKLGLDGYAGYPGYNGYTGGLSGYGGYGGYGGGYGGYAGGGYGGYGGYNSYPYSSYYNRLSGAYPYARAGLSGGYSSYPSSYYSGSYGNSIIGGGLGGLGTPGFVPPVAGAAGYQYGPGISGTIY